jgi:hypothetical protein
MIRWLTLIARGDPALASPPLCQHHRPTGSPVPAAAAVLAVPVWPGPAHAARWLAGDVAQELGLLAEGGSNLSAERALVADLLRAAGSGGDLDAPARRRPPGAGARTAPAHPLGGDRGGGAGAHAARHDSDPASNADSMSATAPERSTSSP